ncbi:hypothetical protein HpHNI79_05700 [Helicobacter pylori]
MCIHTNDTIGYETLKNLPGVEIARIDTNDTWARDFGAKSLPLTRNTNYYSFMGAELKYRRLYSVYLSYVFAY